MADPMPDILDLPVPTDADSAVDALRWFETHIGGGFHPDTRGSDYVEHDTGKPTFTARQAEHYERVMNTIFYYLDDPYEVTVRIMNELREEAP